MQPPPWPFWVATEPAVGLLSTGTLNVPASSLYRTESLMRCISQHEPQTAHKGTLAFSLPEPTGFHQLDGGSGRQRWPPLLPTPMLRSPACRVFCFRAFRATLLCLLLGVHTRSIYSCRHSELLGRVGCTVRVLRLFICAQGAIYRGPSGVLRVPLGRGVIRHVNYSIVIWLLSGAKRAPAGLTRGGKSRGSQCLRHLWLE